MTAKVAVTISDLQTAQTTMCDEIMVAVGKFKSVDPSFKIENLSIYTHYDEQGVATNQIQSTAKAVIDGADVTRTCPANLV